MIWAYLGPPRAAAAAARLRVAARAGDAPLRVEDVRRRATTCRRSKAGSTPRTRRSRTTSDINDPTWFRNRDTHPQLDVEKTDYGFRYAVARAISATTGSTCASITTSCRRSSCAAT